MRRVAIACSVALALGLALGLALSSGDDAGAAAELRPASVTLEPLATPAVGAVDVRR